MMATLGTVALAATQQTVASGCAPTLHPPTVIPSLLRTKGNRLIIKTTANMGPPTAANLALFDLLPRWDAPAPNPDDNHDVMDW